MKFVLACTMIDLEREDCLLISVLTSYVRGEKKMTSFHRPDMSWIGFISEFRINKRKRYS